MCVEFCKEISFLKDYAEYVIAVVSLALRFMIRPRLHFSFDHESSDVVTKPSQDNDSVSDFYRLRVKNIGNQRMLNPRAWCVLHSVYDPESGTYRPRDMTPIELSWADTDDSVQVGIIVPGPFCYRINLFSVLRSISNGTGGFDEIGFGMANFDIQGRNTKADGEPGLVPELQHKLDLIISHENLLLSSYHIEVLIYPNSDHTAPIVKVQNHGEYTPLIKGLLEKAWLQNLP